MRIFADEDDDDEGRSKSEDKSSSSSSGTTEKDESMVTDQVSSQKSDRTSSDSDNPIESLITSDSIELINNDDISTFVSPSPSPPSPLLPPPSLPSLPPLSIQHEPTLPDLLSKFSNLPQCISLYSKYYSLIDPENTRLNEPKFTYLGVYFKGTLDYIFYVDKHSHRRFVHQTDEASKISERQREREQKVQEQENEEQKGYEQKSESEQEPEGGKGKKEISKESKYTEKKLIKDNVTEKVNKSDNFDNETREVRVLSLLKMPSEEDLNAMGLYLPNKKFGSDHFCLMVEIEII